MRRARGVGQGFAQRHIAAAFAVHRARPGEAPETFAKARRRRRSARHAIRDNRPAASRNRNRRAALRRRAAKRRGFRRLPLATLTADADR